MTRLTKGMYGVYRLSPEVSLFNLYSGQMRGGKTKMTHNSGWYNKRGEKLGWGDLSSKDFQRISRGLKKDELFIILSERYSRGPEMESPSVDYVVEQAMYVIAQNKLYLVDRYGSLTERTVEERGLHFEVLNHEAIKRLIFDT